MRPALALVALLALAACDSTADRAVGPAGDFPTVTLAALLTAESGRYNVVGEVRRVEACDVGTLALCAARGVLTVAEGPEPVSEPVPVTAAVLVDVPEAWAVGDRGTFSVETLAAPGTPNRVVRLVGYSP